MCTLTLAPFCACCLLTHIPCRDCYDSNHPLSCHRLGEYLYFFDTNYEKAAELFEDNCYRRGHGESCFTLGTMYMSGMGAVFSKQHETAKEPVLIRPASLSSSLGTNDGGSNTAAQDSTTLPEVVWGGRQRKVKWTIPPTTLSPDRNTQDSSSSAGVGADGRVGVEVQQPGDVSATIESVDAAIAGPVVLSGGIGTFENPEAVLRSPERAAAAYQLACDKGVALGCYNLATCYAESTGVAPEEETSSGSSWRWSKSNAEDRGPGSHKRRAIQLYGRACDEGVGDSCLRLGSAFLHGDKRGVGKVLGTKRDPAEAKKWLDKACDSGRSMACQNLATMFLHGDGVEKDEAKAEVYKAKYFAVKQKAREQAAQRAAQGAQP